MPFKPQLLLSITTAPFAQASAVRWRRRETKKGKRKEKYDDDDDDDDDNDDHHENDKLGTILS